MNKYQKNGKISSKTSSESVSEAQHSPNTPISTSRSNRPVVITGGAGFIGTNVANQFLAEGRRVIIVDNLARPGVSRNLDWLTRTHGEHLSVEEIDVRNESGIRNVVRHASQVFHFAAQVAVTTSLDDPIADFEVNARGTLNVLEAVRALQERPPVLFTSTNKVYGSLDDVELETQGKRYEPVRHDLRESGIDESRSIEFHSPYGCSKGAADQYVLDYARTFGLPAVVFRMSCIYGPHQCGNEDQGWIAHFLLRALAGEPITLYGDGMQVRDALYVDDLVSACRVAVSNIDRLSGQAFNIGGGPQNAVSLLEVLETIGQLCEGGCDVQFDDWRAADQRYYVSDTRRFEEATGWTRETGVDEGIRRLHSWFLDSGSIEEQRMHPPEQPSFSGALGVSG